MTLSIAGQELSAEAEKMRQVYDFETVVFGEVSESLQAIGDIGLRLVDLGVTDGEPTCLQGRTDEGRLKTLYTRELEGPESLNGYKEIFRRVIMGEYGKDSRGQYMKASDFLMNTDMQTARLRTSTVRPTQQGHSWRLSKAGNPIPCSTEDPDKIRMIASDKYEARLFKGMRSANTAMSVLFAAGLAGIHADTKRRVEVVPVRS